MPAKPDLPRLALIGAVAAVAACLAAVAAADSGGYDAHHASALDRILPQAYAHNARITTQEVEGFISGPHKIELFYHQTNMVNVRSLLTNPSISDGHSRPVTAYATNQGPSPLSALSQRYPQNTWDMHHTVTVGGAAMPTDATGSLTIRDGLIWISHYNRATGTPEHWHRLHPTRHVDLHDRQPPLIDTSVRPTLDMSAGTFTFRATEPLTIGPGGATPQNVGIAGLGSLTSSATVSVSGADVTITMSPATHERIDKTLNSWPSSTTTTTMKFATINLRDIATRHDAEHGHYGYDLNSGRWWMPITIVRDTAPPVLVGSPRLDFNTGVLTITFDEPISYVYMPYLFLEDRNGGSRQHVTGASYPSGLDSTVVPITLSQSQLERLSSMYAATGGLRIDMHRGIVRDAASNIFAAVYDKAIDVVPDNVKPRIDAGRAPSVDLARQRVTMHFAEAMDVSRTDTSKILVSNGTGTTVRLSDGTATGRDGRAVTISFPPATKAMIADLGTPLRVGAESNATRDIQGNGNDPVAARQAAYARDTSRPGIVWGEPALDLGTGLLTIPTNDVIDTARIYPRGFELHLTDSSDAHRRTDVSLSGANVTSAGPYTETIELLLTAPQKAAAVSASADGAPNARIGIRGWAYQDYPGHNHGWYVFRSGGASVAVAADRVPPSLASAPVVSLDDGTIRLEFDEYIDASRIGGSGVAVSVFANGSVPLPTGGGLPAAAGQADGTLVVLDMTDALEDAAYNAHGNGSTFSLGVPGAAFYDLSGNAFAGAANQAARATANQSALALASDPRLDLGSGELVFEFNRNVSAPAPSSLSDIAVAGAADGAARTNMSGLPVNHAGRIVSIPLTADLKAALAGANATSGGLTVSVGPGVFADDHHHTFAGLANATLDVVADGVPPEIAGGPSLDLRAARLSITFDEHIDMDRVDPGKIALYGGGGGSSVRLDGATVWPAPPTAAVDDDVLVVALQPQQVLRTHIALRASASGTLHANISSSAVYDLSGNAFAGADAAPVSIGQAGGGGGGGGGSGTGANPRGAGQPFPVLPPMPNPGSGPAGAGSVDALEGVPGGPGPAGWDNGGGGGPAEPLHLYGTPPVLQDQSPIRLDLNTGVLEVRFVANSFIDLTLVNLSGAAIRGSGNGVHVPLAGAEHGLDGLFGTTSADTVVVYLTAAQKAAAVKAGSGAVIDIPYGAFWDASPMLGGDSFGGVRGQGIAITSDATPPSLLPNSSSLDLGSGRLALVFDEYIAAHPAAVDPADFDIVAAGGNGNGNGNGTQERVNLGGARSISAYNDTVAIVLSDLQKALVVGGVVSNASQPLAGNASVSTAAAGAVRDVSGNAMPALAAVPVNTVPDGTTPALASAPILNLGTGTLALGFDEYVAASGIMPAHVGIAAQNGSSTSWQPQSLATAEDGARLEFAFAGAQADALRQANASAAKPLVLGVAAAAGIADLSGNAFEAAGVNITTVDDSTPPALEPGTLPVLDIGRGTITMRFTEHIEPGGIDISGMAIEDAGGASRVPLAGAAAVKPPVDPSSEFITEEDASLVITLTAAQKGAVAAAQIAAGPVRIDAPPSAITDAAGFEFAGMSNHPLDIVPDTAPPAVAGPPAPLPSLDMARGVLSVQFDESVDADTADPSAFVLHSVPVGEGARPDPASVMLGGASVLQAAAAAPLGGGYSSLLEIRLTAAQLAAVSGLSGSAAPPSVNLTIAAGAVRDVSGNAFRASDVGPIAADADDSPPVLAAEPVLDLNEGTVLLEFAEYVNASGIDLSRISLAGTGAAPALVQLGGEGASGGSAQASAHGPSIASSDGSARASASVLVHMTGEQKALAAHASVSQISIGQGAVDDLSANAFEGVDGALLAVIPDETAPSLAASGSYLHMGDGVLHAVFDEHIDPAAVDPSRIVLSVSRASANGSAPSLTGLAGAAPLPSSLYTADASVQLTAGQRAAVQGAVNAASGQEGEGGRAAVTLIVLPGAAFDLSGNGAARSAAAAAVQLRADASPPALSGGHGPNPAVLNLEQGTLTLNFGEYIDASSANASAITIEDSAEGRRTTLANASLAGIADSDRIVVVLTPAQRSAAQAANASADGPVRIDIDAAGPAFRDLAGNALGGLSNLSISTTNDSAAPKLVGMPALDLSGAEAALTMRFDKRIPAGAADASGMYIRGADGTTGTTSLAGAAAVSHRQELLPGGGQEGATSVVAVRLTPAQKASVVESYLATDPPAATLDVSPSAVEDLWHNRFAGLAAGPINVTADAAPPGMAGAPVVDLGAGTVRITFDEFVRASSANASALSIAAGSNRTSLAGAHTLTYDNGPSILFAMTADQKAAIESGYAREGQRLAVSAGASLVRDMAGVPFAAGAPAVNATVHADSAPPTLLPEPSLDLGGGLLVLEFSEHVDASGADPSAALIVLPPSPSGFSTQPVGLSGASAAAFDSGGARVEIALTADQKGRLSAAAGAAGAGAYHLRLGQEFVFDLGGNPNAAVHSARVDVKPDRAAPSLDPAAPPTLDLGGGALRVSFTEQVDPAASDLANLSIAATATSAPVSLASAHVEPRDGRASALTLLLTPDEKGALLASLPAGSRDGGLGEARLYVGRGAFSDLSGNPVGESDAPVSVSADETVPLLDRSADPLFNTARSTIEFDFDEYVDPAAANASRIAIRSYALSSPTTIELDASMPVAPAEDGRTGPWHRIAVDLDGTRQADDLAAAVAAVGAGVAGQLRIDVGRGAFSDLSGNEFAGIGSHALAIADDIQAPALVGPPSLDLGPGMLSLRFSEPVLAAPGVLRTSDILIGGPNGSTPVALDRSRVVAQDAGRAGASPLVEIELDAHDLARARALYLQGGAGAAMTITVPAADIRDRAYNEFAGLDGAHLDIVPDAAGPALSAGAAAPVLDMAAGMLSVPLDEAIDAARIDPSRITLRLGGGGGSDGTSLAGSHASVAAAPASSASASAADAAVAVAVVELSHAQKAALAAEANAAEESGSADPRISIAAGAFSDLSGNAAPAVEGARLSVVPDDRPPAVDALAAPVLDLGGRTLEIHFDEYVHAAASDLSLIDVSVIDGSGDGDGRHRIRLDAARIDSDAADADTVRIRLTAGQAAALATAVESSALIGFADPALLLISDGAVVDLSGNGIAGRAGGGAGTEARLAVIPDAAPPALDPARQPVLDLGAGALTVWLDEYVDAASADTSRLSLAAAAAGAAANRTVSLAGASALAADAQLGAYGADSIVVVVRLTHVQKAWASAVLASPSSPSSASSASGISLSMSSGAFSDLSGNAVPATAAASPAPVAVLADSARPQLDGLPVLNLASGTLTFDLDEFADASAASAAGMSVEDAAAAAGAAARTNLSGAAVSDVPHGADAGLPDSYSDRIVVSPTPAQMASILAYEQPIRLADLPEGSLSDLAGNGIERLVRVPLVHTNDTAGPALERALVDLRDGDVVLEFDEAVDAAGAVVSHMSLAPPGSDPSGHYLAGAALLLPPGGAPTDRIELRLSGAQKSSAALAYAASGSLAFGAPAGYVDDPFGNHAAAANRTAAVVEDDRPPELLLSGPQAPVLDLGTGVLTLRFDEHVSAAGINASAVSVRGVGGAASSFSLSSSSSHSPPPAAVPLSGSEAGSAAAAGSGAYSDAISISLPPAAKAAAVRSVGSDSLAALLDIGASASIADASSVPLEAVREAPLLVRPDHAPPHIVAAGTVLDLAAGTLTVAFDEHVLPGRADASRIAIAGPVYGRGARRQARRRGCGARCRPVVRCGHAQADGRAGQGGRRCRAGGRVARSRQRRQRSPPLRAVAAHRRRRVRRRVGQHVRRHAGDDDDDDGIRPGRTLPPVSVLGASVESPGTAQVRYTHNLTSSSSPGADYALEIDGARRTIAAVDGSNGAASHTLRFEPADAAPDATGTVDIGQACQAIGG